jgi:predicted nucleotidyltransferase
MESEILRRLEEIEATHQVRVVYACEAGSRAWGFPSRDSDHEVRFLYVHPVTWYLSIEDGRDVIEEPAYHPIDLSGWDLKKALQLFHKSNVPLLEWLDSPSVYRDHLGVAQRLRDLAPTHCALRTCLYHYVNLSQREYRESIKSDPVSMERLLYIARPLLAARWIEAGLGIAPTRFTTLVERLVESPAVRADITTLLEAKRQNVEEDPVPDVPHLWEYIEREISRFDRSSVESGQASPPIAPLDELFRATLAQAWPAGTPMGAGEAAA